MHVNEIDLTARQATIHSLVRGGCGRPSVAELREVIARYRGPKRTPVLFGGHEDSGPSREQSPFGRRGKGG